MKGGRGEARTTTSSPGGSSSLAVPPPPPPPESGAASKEATAVASAARSALEGLSVDEANAVVRAALGTVCWKHCVDYKDLLQTHEAACGGGVDGAIRGQVQLVLTDPPYSTRRELGARDAEYDVFEAGDYAACARLFRDLLRPGGQALIFCSYRRWTL